MLSALRALLAPFWSYSRKRTAAQRDSTTNRLATSVYIALSLLIHCQSADRSAPRRIAALGLVGGTERINPVFMSP
jgi:hypothetical protein